MPNTAYSVDGSVIDFNARHTVPQFTLMQPCHANVGRALYVQANGSIAASQSDITVATTGQASDGLGTWSNTVAFADNEYGWVWLAEANS
jgi:predicted ATP-grasp superfamily ATP-dependent carboligase